VIRKVSPASYFLRQSSVATGNYLEARAFAAQLRPSRHKQEVSLVVPFHEGRRQLQIVELNRAA